MARAGHDVITEAVILPNTIDGYLGALVGIPVMLVGVRCPLEIAQRREHERTDRLGGPVDLAVPDFDAVHEGVLYDVDFDTSVISPLQAVALVRGRVESGAPFTAFETLSRRHGVKGR